MVSPLPDRSPPSASGGIVIVSRGDESYGVMTELLNFARAFRDRGRPVTIHALGEGGFVDAARAIGGLTVHVDPDRPERYDPARHGKIGGYVRVLRSMAGVCRRLRRRLVAQRPDSLIFCEHGLVLPLAAAVTGTGVPSFWLMPNIVSGHYPADLNRRLYAAAFRSSGMVAVANSAFTRQTLGRAGKNAETIDLGVEPAPFLAKPEDDPLAKIVPDGALRLLVMARLTPLKGQLELIRGLFAQPEAAAVHAVIGGGPLGTPYAAALLEEAARAGAADRLHLIGPIADTAPYYHACDAIASVRVDPEPFGLSIVEAMLAGKPVIAHALGGPTDIVVDGETGWHLAAMGPDTVAAGLSRMLSDRPRWQAMGEAGRRRALERYTVDAMTDQLEAVFARHGIRPA